LVPHPRRVSHRPQEAFHRTVGMERLGPHPRRPHSDTENAMKGWLEGVRNSLRVLFLLCSSTVILIIFMELLSLRMGRGSRYFVLVHTTTWVLILLNFRLAYLLTKRWK